MAETSSPYSEARERVLNVAERLFSEKGYASVTLRDIARELDIRQASLYYHVPGGKEALYIEVTERMLHRYRLGIQQAIESAEDNLRSQMIAAITWMLAQPVMNLGRMIQSDMPAISDTEAATLEALAYEALYAPLDNLFRRAYNQQRISRRPELLAGLLLSIVEGLNAIPKRPMPHTKPEMVEILIDTILEGLNPR